MSNQTWNTNPNPDDENKSEGTNPNEGYNPPSYGAPATPNPADAGQGYTPPSYGQPDQAYGQGSPTPYGQPTPSTPYGQPTPGTPYGQPNQPYGQAGGYTPDQSIGQPGTYGAPGQGYGDPNAAYGAPGGGYPAQQYPPQGAGNLATWGKRAYGALFDYVIPGAIYGVLQAPFQASMNSRGEMVGGNGIVLFLLWVALMGFMVWNVGLVGGKTGQTIGRKMAKTRVVGEATGQPIGVGPSILRYLAHFIDSVICYVGWLFPLWDAKKQTIADKIMKTVSIDESGAQQQMMR